jgi:HD-GYP domain-containing protein (c-di-GMP phosphodiesterase class II)
MSQDPQKRKARILLIGEDPLVDRILTKFTNHIDLTCKEQRAEDLIEDVDPKPHLVICSTPSGEMDAEEIAQLLSTQYINTDVVIAVDKQSMVNKRALIKNGFKDVFFLPTDDNTFTQYIEDKLTIILAKGFSYRPIKISDINPGDELDFETFVHLQANNKYVIYSQVNSSISKERKERLESHNIACLYIKSEDMGKFTKYAQKHIASVLGKEGISDTERGLLLKQSVRKMLSDIMSSVTGTYESGRKTLGEGQEIVNAFIKSSVGSTVYNRILQMSSLDNDTYAHASNVSAYAYIFALGLGLKNADNIALAALLHDAGLAKVSSEILEKDPSTWTNKEKEEYQKHPKYSLDVVVEKKMVLPDIIRKVIIQHHEQFNGMGYPNQIHGHKITIEAQILGIADKLDYMTSVKAGQKRVKPDVAILQILDSCKIASKAEFSPEIVKKIVELF